MSKKFFSAKNLTLFLFVFIVILVGWRYHDFVFHFFSAGYLCGCCSFATTAGALQHTFVIRAICIARPVRPNSFHLFYPAMRCSYRSSQSPNLRGYCRLSVGQFNATTRTQLVTRGNIFMIFLALFFLTSYSRPLLSSPLRSSWKKIYLLHRQS